ncbi:MAG: hypothetical protein Kow0081_2640 [Candidatus Dojkabacteria bacterium]
MTKTSRYIKGVTTSLILFSFFLTPISPLFNLTRAGLWNYELTACVEPTDDGPNIAHFGYNNKSGSVLEIDNTTLSVSIENITLPSFLSAEKIDSSFSFPFTNEDLVNYSNNEVKWEVIVGNDKQEIALNAATPICDFNDAITINENSIELNNDTVNDSVITSEDVTTSDDSTFLELGADEETNVIAENTIEATEEFTEESIGTNAIQNEETNTTNEPNIEQDTIVNTLETPTDEGLESKESYSIELSNELIKEPLLGADMVAKTKLTNTSLSRMYKARIEIVLPDGVSYNSAPSEYAAGFDATYTASSKNHYINTNPSVLTIEDSSSPSGFVTKLVWSNIADLLEGESVTVFYKLNIAGSPTFYIDDQIDLQISGQLYADVTHEEPATEKNTNLLAVVRAFRLETKRPSEVVTGTDEGFVKEKEIKIINNPEVNSLTETVSTCEESDESCNSNCEQDDFLCEANSENVVITETLDEGVEYVEGSQSINTTDPLTGGTINVEHDFAVKNIEGGITILDDEKDKGINRGEVIEDDEIYSTETKVEADYETREGPLRISLSEESSVQAKYVKINKSADKEVINPGDVIVFSISVQTSQYYDFSNVEISDVLPDGYTFLSNGQISPPANIELVQFTENPDGTTNLTWNIEGIPAASNFSFEYSVRVDEIYSDGENIVSSDGF